MCYNTCTWSDYMNPEMFSIGNISIKWYSFLIFVGVLIAFLLADREGKRKGFDKDLIFDMGFWVVLFGILGARLYYVLFNFGLYRNDLFEIFKVWNGGLAIHGGILAGLITVIVYCKKHKLKILEMTDIAVPSLIIAQAIGRWGNFFNSEAHGPVTTLDNLQNLKFIPDFVIDGMNINGLYYHPTFFYESVWCLLGFFVLILVRKFLKNIKRGQLTCIYLVWYGIGRFFIESLRTDSLMFMNFKAAQLVSLGMIIIGIVLFIFLIFAKRKDD
ncbi:MAG: prolipoprotein diacylglyceryl transferase [Bacilli bacterium]|nr:prolipoprotein diacylglyceryl transferase [Bacilli bacterium]